MDKLISHLENMNHMIDLEINEVVLLDENQTNKLKSICSIDWTPEPIYVSKTNIIFTDINDYNRVKGLAIKLVDILKIEMQDSNQYLYVCSYVNEPIINQII